MIIGQRDCLRLVPSFRTSNPLPSTTTPRPVQILLQPTHTSRYATCFFNKVQIIDGHVLIDLEDARENNTTQPLTISLFANLWHPSKRGAHGSNGILRPVVNQDPGTQPLRPDGTTISIKKVAERKKKNGCREKKTTRHTTYRARNNTRAENADRRTGKDDYYACYLALRVLNTASPAGRRAPSAPSGLIPFINATSKPLPSCLTLRIGTIPGWSRSKSSPAFPQSVQPRPPKRPQEPRLLRGVTTSSCPNCCSSFPTLAGRWRSENNLEG